MTLLVWTASAASNIAKVVGPVIKQHGTAHKVLDVNLKVPEGELLAPLPATEAGDVVLAMGNASIDLLRAHKVLPKARTIGSMREREFAMPSGARLLVSYDPSLAQKDYARFPEIQWDTALAIRLHETKSLKPKLGDYRYVDDLSDFILKIDAKYEATGQPVDVACDLETLGLVPYDPDAWIICMAFTVEQGKSDLLYFEQGETLSRPENENCGLGSLDYWQALWVQVKWVLTSPKVSLRGANWKFDSNWIIEKWDIYCSNHRFDTLLVGSLLQENRSNSLKLHAKIFTDMGGYEQGLDAYDMARMDLVPKGVNLEYAGADTDATYRVARRFKKDLLADKALATFYVKLLHPASKVFERMERTGIHIDVEYMEELASEVRAEKARLAKEMLDCVPWKLRHKYKNDIVSQLDNEKSPFKPKILKEFLFSPSGLNLKPKITTPKTGEPSTTVDHLLMFDEDEVAQKFVAHFKAYNSAAKTYSTFIEGFMKHLRPDGLFHPTFMLARALRDGEGDAEGAVTGRTSAKDPAVQTIPKRTIWTKRLRRAYVAPEGYCIVQCDFNQGELRIVAVVANEPVMLDAYTNEKDLHAITAARLTGYELADFMLLPEDIRDLARGRGKAGNFGLCYGMQAAGFQDYAFKSYGVKLTDQEAMKSHAAFFELYARLHPWHEEAVKFAHAREFIRSPLGRVRHLPLINSQDYSVRSTAERQAINSPIQSCLSDMAQLAMVGIEEQYGEEDIHPFLMTHDALAYYVPEDEGELWAARIKGVMENLPLGSFGWKPSLQFTADAEMGSNFAELKKLKGLVAA